MSEAGEPTAHGASYALNRANWDERAVAHAASPDYDVERYVAEPARISDCVRFDLPRLGEVRGLRGVYLQCHIGTDTLSLARLGARMTGVDFSAPALAIARDLAARAGQAIDYVEANVYDAASLLPNGAFDLVYTGIGALCWLPDVACWAQVVASLLRPGGRLFIREGHPVLWACDEHRHHGSPVLRYPYFETAGPNVFDEPGTYVETDHEFTHHVTHEWNHGIGEILTAVLDAGLRVTHFVEHDSVPWRALADMVPVGDGEFRLPDGAERLPCSYTLLAVKPVGEERAGS